MTATSLGLLGVGLTLTHFHQTETYHRVLRSNTLFAAARQDLSQGFLIVNLSGKPGSPYDLAQGIARMDQSADELDESLQEWRTDFGPSRALDSEAQDFRAGTERLKTQIGIGDETSLRVEYFRLHQSLDRVARANQLSLENLQTRLSGEFAIVAALIVIALVCLVGGSAATLRQRDRAERHLREVADELGLGLWHVDPTTGKGETSEVLWKLLDAEPQAKFNTPEEWARFLRPEDRPRFLGMTRRVLETDCNPVRETFEVTRADETNRWLEVFISVHRDVRGTPLDIYGSLSDITEVHLAAVQKATLEAQVTQAQKLNAMGQVAGSIAHDLNNLLVPVVTYSELGRSGTGTKGADYYFQKIREVGEKAADLTGRILAFSRNEEPQKETVDLNVLIENFLPFLRHLIREDIRLTTVRSVEAALILADPRQVEQVILNLVVNSRDALPRGGHIEIRVETDQSRAILRVSDDGVGMSDETQRHVFEPFYTTKPRGQGTGLGLATVQRIVEQHGAQIHLESRIDAGTTVSLVWASRHHAPPVEESPVPPVDGTGDHEAVLVVEDEDLVREVVTESLTSQGYRVIAVAGAEHALGINTPYDLVVTDIVMPGQNGKELAEILRKTRPNLPILFMSGYTDSILSGLDREAPHQGFLQKPFAVDVLCRKVRNLLDEA